MNLKFWKKIPRLTAFCNICDKDVTNEIKVYWKTLVYCSPCYKRQVFNGFGKDLK